MPRFNQHFALCLVMGLLLAACAKPPASSIPPVSIQSKAPVLLNVAQIQVVNEIPPSNSSRQVEQWFPTPPYQALRHMVEQRFKAVGSEGIATIHLKDIKVVEENLPVTDGVAGLFVSEPSERYRATLNVAVDAVSGDRTRTASTEIRAEQTTTVQKGATLAEREVVWDKLLQDMLRQLDNSLSEGVRKYLGAFVQ
ncbi:MAG: hypothetical protein ACOYK8_04885 [Alphaproteobacteria bacterium]